jgi:hypothetical protein
LGSRKATSRARSRDHLGGVVDTEHGRAALDDLLRQRTLAAADIEDPLACLGVQEVERSPAELGYEAAHAGVIRGIPLARRGGALAQRVLIQSR